MSTGGDKLSTGTTKTPADFLKSIRGHPVVVKLNFGVDYREKELKLVQELFCQTTDNCLNLKKPD